MKAEGIISLGSRCNAGFTRADLGAAVGILALLGTFMVPAVATKKAESLRLGCLNNLRQVGHGMRIWATDHGDTYPPLVSVQDGGTRLHPFGANAWIHFGVASNELRTPKILACPADENSRQATDFSDSPSGGFLHPDFRNKAISYFIGHPYPDLTGDILAGDRNFFNQGSSSCSFLPVVATVSIGGASLGWTNGIHFNRGQALLNDGRAEPFSNAQLRSYFLQTFSGDFRSSVHFVGPH